MRKMELMDIYPKQNLSKLGLAKYIRLKTAADYIMAYLEYIIIIIFKLLDLSLLLIKQSKQLRYG
jgi:hypothetical protein